MSLFRSSIDFSVRKLESETTLKYWPDKIPIILEKEAKSKMESLEKPKFLCPKEFSVLQFIVYLRKKINLPKKTALFVTVEKGEVLSGDKMMIEIYEKNKNQDGFLYLTYGDHAAFG